MHKNSASELEESQKAILISFSHCTDGKTEFQGEVVSQGLTSKGLI